MACCSFTHGLWSSSRLVEYRAKGWRLVRVHHNVKQVLGTVTPMGTKTKAQSCSKPLCLPLGRCIRNSESGEHIPCYSAPGVGPDPTGEDISSSEFIRHHAKAGLSAHLQSLLAKSYCSLEADPPRPSSKEKRTRDRRDLLTDDLGHSRGM